MLARDTCFGVKFISTKRLSRGFSLVHTLFSLMFITVYPFAEHWTICPRQMLSCNDQTHHTPVMITTAYSSKSFIFETERLNFSFAKTAEKQPPLIVASHLLTNFIAFLLLVFQVQVQWATSRNFFLNVRTNFSTDFFPWFDHSIWMLWPVCLYF